MIRRDFVKLLATATLLCTAVMPIGAAETAPASTQRSFNNEPASIAISPAAELKAREWLLRIRAGNIDRRQLEPRLSALLNDEVIRLGFSYVTKLGSLRALRPFEVRTSANSIDVYYRATFEAETLTWILSTAPTGLINGFVLRRRPGDVIYSARA